MRIGFLEGDVDCVLLEVCLTGDLESDGDLLFPRLNMFARNSKLPLDLRFSRTIASLLAPLIKIEVVVT